jgi:hypothetical protein
MSKYYIIDSSGNKIPFESEGIRRETQVLTADTTLTANDSGKLFLLDAVGEAITLPAVTAGVEFEFLCTADIITSAWTITAASKVISGSAQVAGAVVAAALEDVITFTHTVALIGDWVTIKSDGSAWYVEGSAVASTGITFTGAA